MAGIYVHIPFCKSKCIYCDFYSVPSRERVDAVAEGIIAEYLCRRDEIAGPIDTLYIGGGTPSVLPAGLLGKIIKAIAPGDVPELTIEVNPDDVTPDIARAWADMGVNRVSMGVQTLDDRMLALLRRRHTSRQVFDAVGYLSGAGISNLSCDLIYGLPGQTLDGWADDLRQILRLPVDHLSAYSLTYYEGTALWEMKRRGQVSVADDELTAQMFAKLRHMTAEAGFEHYEISNFARPGRRSRHNSGYWRPDGRWIGLGPAAYSFDGQVRRYNPADIGRWLDALPYPCMVDDETDLDRINDNIVTALRTSDGLDLRTLPEKYAEAVLRAARRHMARGDMRCDGLRLSINPDRWLLADLFIRDMLQE